MRAKICKHVYCEQEDHWDNVVELVGPYNIGALEDINDWASHIYLFHYDPKTEKFVQMFGHERFDASFAGLFPEGQYTSDDIKRHHVDKGGFNHAASSMIVPNGLYAQIFKSDYFSGESMIIEGPREVDFVYGDI